MLHPAPLVIIDQATAIEMPPFSPYHTPSDFLEMVRVMRLPYLRISLTTDCNAHCSFCHNEGQPWGKRGLQTKPREALLPLSAYEYIADFFQSTLNRVKFTGGEPTLALNLPEIIEIFSRRGYNCSITSNGFQLDYDLQQCLARAGLRHVNISFHTTDEHEYDKTFGVRGQMQQVLRNLETLNQIFPNAVKLNFFAIPGQNVPSQLIPMTELSRRMQIIVSFLTDVRDRNSDSPLSQQIIDYLTNILGTPTINEIPDDFYVKCFYHFPNSGVWEIDDFRREGYRQDGFNNPICQACIKRARCSEGPYALRIREDGTAKPCLIRQDNEIPFWRGAYVLGSELSERRA